MWWKATWLPPTITRTNMGTNKTLDVISAVILYGEPVVALIVWQLDLQVPMQSVPITTDVVSLNLDQGEVYNSM